MLNPIQNKQLSKLEKDTRDFFESLKSLVLESGSPEKAGRPRHEDPNVHILTQG